MSNFPRRKDRPDENTIVGPETGCGIFSLVFLGGGVVLVICGGLATLNVLGWFPDSRGHMDVPPLFVLLMGLALISVGAPMLYVTWVEFRQTSTAVRDKRNESLWDELDAPRRRGDPVLVASPGATLPFRLSRERPEIGFLVPLGLFTLFFDGAVSSLIVWVGQGCPVGNQVWMAQDAGHFLSREAGIAVLCLMGLVAIISLGLLFLAVLQAFPIIIGMRAPLVEMSAYPLHINESCDLHISQAGPLRLKLLQVSLTCREGNPSGEKSGDRAEPITVPAVELIRQVDLLIPRGKSYETRFPVSIPAGAPPSYEAEDRTIVWHVVVKARSSLGLSLESWFPFVVLP